MSFKLTKKKIAEIKLQTGEHLYAPSDVFVHTVKNAYNVSILVPVAYCGPNREHQKNVIKFAPHSLQCIRLVMQFTSAVNQV
jgi:hypothetical protein